VWGAWIAVYRQLGYGRSSNADKPARTSNIIPIGVIYRERALHNSFESFKKYSMDLKIIIMQVMVHV
jgi:hypothetical protein